MSVALKPNLHPALRDPFQTDSTFSVISPGRVNLIGEHTDYNGGLVLPMAIEPHIRIDVIPRTDRWMRLSTRWSRESEVKVDLEKPIGASDYRGSWVAYPCGVVAGLQRLGWQIPGFEARISATLPAGAGVSSSAALEVGMATVVEELCGQKLSLEGKALLAQQAEHEFAGVPCGIMDQFAVTFGREGSAMLLDCRSRELRYVPLASEAVSVLVINSGVKHSLADGEYARRRSECESAARFLGVSLLRDVSLPRFLEREETLPVLESRRARHVITEHVRTMDFVNALEAGDWMGAGEKMYGSHASLSADYEVSCRELDLLVEISHGIAGVFGCRMTGGGFGGCVVALIASARAEEVQIEFRKRYQKATGIDPALFVTKAANGAGLLK